MSKKTEIESFRKKLGKLEVPKMVVWIDNETKVETTNLVEKTIDEIIALTEALIDTACVEAVQVALANSVTPKARNKQVDKLSEILQEVYMVLDTEGFDELKEKLSETLASQSQTMHNERLCDGKCEYHRKAKRYYPKNSGVDKQIFEPPTQPKEKSIDNE